MHTHHQAMFRRDWSAVAEHRKYLSVKLCFPRGMEALHNPSYSPIRSLFQPSQLQTYFLSSRHVQNRREGRSASTLCLFVI